MIGVGLLVGELKKMLEGVDDNRVVVISRDIEGNGYSPAWNASLGAFYPHDSEVEWCKESDDVQFDERAYSRVETDEMKKGVRAFIMWPRH